MSERRKEVSDQVVRQWFDRHYALPSQDNRGRLRIPDMDRQKAAVAIGRAQPQDSLPPGFGTLDR
ncbi:hypothetical protein NWFMUON74_20900 [Nocardia wallacei]|uniref:Uncharacterized protein n=1 Tax=Nocardia wallacei TaxID=480035 RepID=A0A7G1KGT7_9NOCA|nr:hypothetical protein NWFMUON74_20900 [Nocardia wallacei]